MTYLQRVFSDMIRHWRDHPYFNDKENLSLLRRHFFDLIKGSALIQVIVSLILYFSMKKKKDSNIFHDSNILVLSSMRILEDSLIIWIDFDDSFIFFLNNDKISILMCLYICSCILLNRYWFCVSSFRFQENIIFFFNIWKKKKSRWLMILMISSLSQQMSMVENLF